MKGTYRAQNIGNMLYVAGDALLSKENSLARCSPTPILGEREQGRAALSCLVYHKA